MPNNANHNNKLAFQRSVKFSEQVSIQWLCTLCVEQQHGEGLVTSAWLMLNNNDIHRTTSWIYYDMSYYREYKMKL